MDRKLDKAIIVDLDGTLCDCEWRLPFIKEKPKQWGKFFRGIPKDEIIVPVKEYIEEVRSNHYKETGEFVYLIFLTARPTNTSKDTLDWLHKHGYNNTLYMRKDGDYRVDVEVKEEIFKAYIHNVFDVLLVLDDKKEIRDMFEKNYGIFTVDPVAVIELSKAK